MSDSERSLLYKDIALCPLQCAGIVNDRSAGLIPRSYYWEDEKPTINLLVVSKNPANAPAWESELYSRTPPEELAAVHLEVGRDLFLEKRSVASTYHVNLVRRVAAVLGVQATAGEVFKQAAMTALAKCQSSGSKTAKIPDDTYAACAERHLFREIEHFQPVYLLALGKEPYDFLTSPAVAMRHKLPVGKLWHPSWSNMPGGEVAYFSTVLPCLNKEYVKAMQMRGRSEA